MYSPIHTRLGFRLVAPLLLAFSTLVGFGAAPDLAAGEVPPTGGLSSDTVAVFVVWGSSNACNPGTPGVPPEADSPEPVLGTAFEYYWRALEEYPPIPLLDPMPCHGRDKTGTQPVNEGSAWPQFAITYHDSTSHTVFMSSTARGGSWVRQVDVPPVPGGHSGDWSPASTNELYDRGRLTIQRAMNEAESFFNRVPPADTTVVFGGVIWWQGNDLSVTDPPWTEYEAALHDLLTAYGEDVLNGTDPRLHTGRFYYLNSAVRRDDPYPPQGPSDPDYHFAFDLEAGVCAEYPFCSAFNATIYVKEQQLMCGGVGSTCGGWYAGGEENGPHLGQTGLNYVGDIAGAGVASHRHGDPSTYELAVEVPQPRTWLGESPRPVRLDVYDDAGALLRADTLHPSIADPDWRADFDGSDPDADWRVDWATLSTDFLTVELAWADAPGAPLARYAYAPTALSHAPGGGAGSTDFFRPAAGGERAAAYVEVLRTGEVRARSGPVAGGGRVGPFFEDAFAGGADTSYVLPYNHFLYEIACTADCPSGAPDYFLARLPVGEPRPSASLRRFVFADEGHVVIPYAWGTQGVVEWDVAGLVLAFPEGRRLEVDGTLVAEGVRLTAAVDSVGWGGLAYYDAVPEAVYTVPNVLSGSIVEKVKREVGMGMAVPYGAVSVHGRDLVVEDLSQIRQSEGGVTGLLVTGSSADVSVTGQSFIRDNDGGGLLATGGAHVTVSGDSEVRDNTGGAGVTASGFETTVDIVGAHVLQNGGVGVRALSQATVAFASDEGDPETHVEDNEGGGLDAGAEGSLDAGRCTTPDCDDRVEHFIRFNALGGHFDARALTGSTLYAQGNIWHTTDISQLVLVQDSSSVLVVCPLVGGGPCGIDARLSGGARRGGEEPPLRIEDVLALVDEAERARLAGDEGAFEIAATAAVIAIDTSRAEDDRRAAFGVTSRLFAWAQPAGPLAALEALAEAPGEGRPWALRALGVARAAAEGYDDARAIADTLVAQYAESEHAAFGLALSVRVGVAEGDEAAAVAALLALASAFPEPDAVGPLAALVVGAFPEADLSGLRLGGGEAPPPTEASATAAGAPGALLAVDAVRPNPASGSATVPFALAGEAEVEAVLYDVLGRRLAVLASGRYEAGRHALTLGEPLTRRLPSGVYVVTVTAAGPARGAKEDAGPASVAMRRFTLTR